MDQEKKLGQERSVSQAPRKASSTREPTLESARVLRLAENLNLSVQSLEAIKTKLFGIQGRDISAIEARAQETPKHYPKVETISEAEAIRLKEVGPSLPPPPPKVAKTAKPSPVLEEELLLRKKIEASQTFSDFKGEAWKLYETYPRPDVGGRLLELALMYGTASELEDVLKTLAERSLGFFEQLASQTRTQLLLKLWQAKRQTTMDALYFRKDLSLHLLPIERWYLAWSLVEQNRSDALYRFWKAHEADIAAMQKQFGAQLGLSDSRLSYALGSAAFRMNDEEAALKLLEQVPKSAPEFPHAIDLLLDVRVDRDEQGLSSYEHRLSRELDWKARLNLLDSFLIRIQRVEHAAPKDRAALNALLKDPLRWFPESAEAWHLVADKLLTFSGLERLLPNILRVFHDNSIVYQKPSFEHALWATVLDHDFRDPVATLYWRSVALLHDFALGLGEEEKKLWQARELYEEAQSYLGQGRALPRKWQELHEALMQWMAKSDRLDETQRRSLLMMGRLTADAKDISEADVMQYLTHVPVPNLGVMERIEILARERKQLKLEAFAQSRKAEQLHYTNQSLLRLFQLSVEEKRGDQCWRVLTLLRVRQVLAPELEKSWAISGEKRRDFPYNDLSESQLRIIFEQFSGDERRLVEAVASVGPLIPELLANLNPHLVPQKRTRPVTKTETEISEFLESLSSIPESRKKFSAGSGSLWQVKPPFFANLADGRWAGLFVALSQRLGINSWDWQLSLLNQHIERLIPKMTRSADAVQVGKVGRWLRSLSPRQRKAWYDLAQVSKKFEDDKAQMVLGRFLAILTTALHQDHVVALATLDKVRAPLRLRWDLENWIVSEAYGELRRSLGTASIAKLPEHVYRMPILSPEPPQMKPKFV